MKMKLSRRWDLLALALILVLALAVRLLGICRGLPYVYYTDESLIINHALAFGTGDLNPHDFIYPSLYMYLLFFIYGVSYVVGWALGVFNSTNDFIRLFFEDVTLFYLPGRLIAALCGVTSVWVVYLFGRRAYDVRVGLIGAAFLCFSVLHVTFSHYTKAHVPAGMLVIIGLYLAWSIYNGGRGWRSYLLAGAVAGLAASTIYHAGFVIVSVVVAHLLCWHDSLKRASEVRLLSPKLFGAIGVCFAAFVLGTPFALLDWRTFLGDLTSHGAMFLHGGFWEKSPFYPLTSLVGNIGRPLGYLSLMGLAHALFRRRPADLILASQPLFLIAFLMVFPIKEPQHMLIAFPAVALLSASFVVDVLTYLIRRRTWQTAILITATIVLLLAPARRSFQASYQMSLPDTRSVAKDWVEQNIRPGSKLVMDSGKYYLSVYGPPLRPSRWTLEQFIARSKSPTDQDLFQRVGSRRAGYAGEAEFFRYQLQSLDDRPGYDIIQILHDPGLAQADVLTLDEYKRMGVEYAIVSSKAFNIYAPDDEQSIVHPDKAARYRDFYQALEAEAALIKEFIPSDELQGPILRIYRIL